MEFKLNKPNLTLEESNLDSDNSLPMDDDGCDSKRPHFTPAQSSSSGEGRKTPADLARTRKERRVKASREKERALEAEVWEAKEGCRVMGVDMGNVRALEALGVQVAKDVDMILKVANLKGAFVKGLKNAAASISTAVEALKERTSSDEVRKLLAENTRLRRDLEDLVSGGGIGQGSAHTRGIWPGSGNSMRNGQIGAVEGILAVLDRAHA